MLLGLDLADLSDHDVYSDGNALALTEKRMYEVFEPRRKGQQHPRLRLNKYAMAEGITRIAEIATTTSDRAWIAQLNPAIHRVTRQRSAAVYIIDKGPVHLPMVVNLVVIAVAIDIDPSIGTVLYRHRLRER